MNQRDLTSHQLLAPTSLILTSALFFSNYYPSPNPFTHCNRKDTSQIKMSVNAVFLLDTLEWVHHWVQEGLQTSSCDLHTDFFSHPVQFFRSQLGISSSGMPLCVLELGCGAFLWASQCFLGHSTWHTDCTCMFVFLYHPLDCKLHETRTPASWYLPSA